MLKAKQLNVIALEEEEGEMYYVAGWGSELEGQQPPTSSNRYSIPDNLRVCSASLKLVLIIQVKVSHLVKHGLGLGVLEHQTIFMSDAPPLLSKYSTLLSNWSQD